MFARGTNYGMWWKWKHGCMQLFLSTEAILLYLWSFRQCQNLCGEMEWTSNWFVFSRNRKLWKLQGMRTYVMRTLWLMLLPHKVGRRHLLRRNLELTTCSIFSCALSENNGWSLIYTLFLWNVSRIWVKQYWDR